MPPKKEAKKEDKKEDKKEAKKDDKKEDKKDEKDATGAGKGKDKGKKTAKTKKKSDEEVERAFKPDDEEELMAPSGSKRRARKERYADKLRKFLHEYKNALICTVDFVGSNQMQQVRAALRGKAEILMGKNTVIRKIVREEAAANPKLLELLPLVQGNIGFAWTNGKLGDVRKLIVSNKVPAAAKTGNYAPEDVIIQAGPTGLDPGQTSFFQALNISTKIARGSIEIINKVVLVKKGERVTASHVSLLSKLDLKPFSYGIKVTNVYENGAVYKSEVLDLSQDDLMNKWLRGVRHVAALSLAIGHPTAASLPHSIANAMKKMIAICIEVDYTFEAAKKYTEHFRKDSKKAEKKKEEGGEEEEGEEEEAGEEEEDAGKKKGKKEEAEEEEEEAEEDEEEDAGKKKGKAAEKPKAKKEEEEEEEEQEDAGKKKKGGKDEKKPAEKPKEKEKEKPAEKPKEKPKEDAPKGKAPAKAAPKKEEEEEEEEEAEEEEEEAEAEEEEEEE
jgi:large subunit ribosomal protein LP0